MSNQPPPLTSPISVDGNEKKIDLIHAEYTKPNEGPLDATALAADKINALQHGEEVQMKSELDGLSIFKAAWVYRTTVMICVLAGISAAADGFQNQVASSIVANKGFILQFHDGYLNAKKAPALPPKHVSVYSGIFSAGQVVGQFGMQFMADKLGRKMAMYSFLVILLLTVITETVSRVWWHWALAKLIGGIGIGAVQATLPVYINEHAPVNLRGSLIVAYSLWFSAGGLFGSVTLKKRSISHPLDWKTPIYVQYGLLGACAILYVFLPESPWWLAGKGRLADAEKVMKRKYKNIPGYDVGTELAIVAATVEKQKLWAEEQKTVGKLAMLKGLNGKRFLIASWPKVLQQFVGLSVFSNNSTYFFQLAGNKDPFMVTVILGCVSLASVIVDASLVDRIGRRRMTLIGFTGAVFGVTLMAIIGCFNYETKTLGSVLVFSGVIANFCNTFQSSTSYAYLTEVPEIRFRARTTGWGLAYCNLYAVLFNFTVPLMLKVWKVKTAFLFVGLGLPGTVIAYFIMPETAQRSPAEIQEMFEKGVSLRKFKGYVTDVEKDLQSRKDGTIPAQYA